VPIAPDNLPHQPTPFIGRGREVDALRSLVRRERVQLVSLTGPGGTGKTRLALEAAGHLRGGFPDGISFVPLASITDADLVATSIAEGLGIMEAGDKDRPLVESLKSHLRDKNLLLVLDNFEQVLDAAPIVGELIGAAPQLKVLVTSRERLHLRGEYEFPVPPLEVPAVDDRRQALEGMAALAGYESVRLFVERASALRPDFELRGENAAVVAEICARLDGLPLAIELAAARIKILNPEAILSRLEHRLKLLTSGERDLPPRHQTLRAAIGWSYDLLNDGEKALFRRLSVFSGSSSLEAIEAVCVPRTVGEGQTPSKDPYALHATRYARLDIDALDGIASLVDKNLLRQHGEVAGEPRFNMLETIGEYAREKLEESGEAGWAQRLHAACFLEMAEAAEPELKGPKQVEWLRRLEAEHDNMRAALRWALAGQSADDSARTASIDSHMALSRKQPVSPSEIALRLGAALHGFWRMRGHFTEGRSWLESALSDTKDKPSPARAKALMAVGTLSSSQGDFVRARAALEESLSIFRELGDLESVASTLRNLGNELRYRGDLEGSWSALEEALGIARELGKEWDIASLLGDLGIVAQTLGNDDAARQMYEESLALRREMSDTRGIAMMLVNLGELARAAGEYDRAGEMYTEALGLARELGDKWGVGMVLHNLGHVANHRRDYMHAWNLFAESLRIFHELRNKRDIAYCLAALGGLFGARKQLERASVLFSASQALSNTISSHLDPADQVEYERNLAATKSQMSQGDWDRAWVRGQALTLDEAVAYALEIPATLDQTKPLPAPPKVTAPLGLTTMPLIEQAALTEREVEVLQLVAMGLQDAQVAEQLEISPRTVHRHLSSIYSKLGVTSRTAAVRAAGDLKLV
jgi:predicted ATPase/DNA-binding CsgD family transcriptional regulator/Flp pilus assembly protein TadD